MTLDQIGPYLQARERQILFREAVLAFFGVGQKKSGEGKERGAYCEACHKAGLQDCGNCDPGKIMVIK